MNLREELPLLRAKAHAARARLDRLNRNIGAARHITAKPSYCAAVDPEKCIGCGICEKVCPVGAVFVKKTALVDTKRCTGCGGCAEACPQEAVLLHPCPRQGAVM